VTNKKKQKITLFHQQQARDMHGDREDSSHFFHP